MYTRPSKGERTILVHVKATSHHALDFDPEEFALLAEGSGAQVLDEITFNLRRCDPKFLISTGHIESLALLVQEHKADLILLDHPLSPSQERNIEKAIHTRVLDRTGLILDIFAKRARSYEGKLQVELAQLRYHATRLIRGWTHLERQRGGAIGLTGPGETQLELDRRLIRNRIKLIKQRLEKVAKQRALSRQKRHKSNISSIALVGYTNAGKSTLFEALTGRDIYIADQLFATLDTTMSHFYAKDLGKLVLADTVGFIKNLPHELVQAFRATLDETIEADLLLHVVDYQNEHQQTCIAEVEKVLADIGAKAPIVKVFNKADKHQNDQNRIVYNSAGQAVSVLVSAKEKTGMEALAQAIKSRLSEKMFVGTLTLSNEYAKLRAFLYQEQLVLNEHVDEKGQWQLYLQMPQDAIIRLCHRYGVDEHQALTKE